jgi:hypothetical protein
MEILGKVILMGLLLAIVGTILRLLSFIYEMLNPKFRNEYFMFRNICKELKETGNVNLLEKFIQNKSKKKSEFYYYFENDNKLKDDELFTSKYEKQRENYIRIIDTINLYSLTNYFKKSLKQIPNKHLVKYLINELKVIEPKKDDEKYHVTEQKILSSKKRFITYLMESSNEDKENLEILLDNIELKIK